MEKTKKNDFFRVIAKNIEVGNRITGSENYSQTNSRIYSEFTLQSMETMKNGSGGVNRDLLWTLQVEQLPRSHVGQTMGSSA